MRVIKLLILWTFLCSPVLAFACTRPYILRQFNNNARTPKHTLVIYPANCGFNQHKLEKKDYQMTINIELDGLNTFKAVNSGPFSLSCNSTNQLRVDFHPFAILNIDVPAFTADIESLRSVLAGLSINPMNQQRAIECLFDEMPLSPAFTLARYGYAATPSGYTCLIQPGMLLYVHTSEYDIQESVGANKSMNRNINGPDHLYAPLYDRNGMIWFTSAIDRGAVGKDIAPSPLSGPAQAYYEVNLPFDYDVRHGDDVNANPPAWAYYRLDFSHTTFSATQPISADFNTKSMIVRGDSWTNLLGAANSGKGAFCLVYPGRTYVEIDLQVSYKNLTYKEINSTIREILGNPQSYSSTYFLKHLRIERNDQGITRRIKFKNISQEDLLDLPLLADDKISLK